MTRNPLNIAIFAHSWVSDWNHGNAHFLRGLARELGRIGHKVRCYEQLGSWSLSCLVEVEGERAIDSIDHFRNVYPDLRVFFYRNDSSFVDFASSELRNTDVVIIHEWNDPRVVNTILSLKQRFGFRALFHDTHHRAYTSPGEILRFHMHLFDGVLAFGDPVRKVYQDGFGITNVWTFHEAADVENFKPRESAKTIDVLWIGNWGDEERTQELEEFLIGPALTAPQRKIVAHGVRYPQQAVQRLTESGIDYRGYLPNLRAPEAYANSMLSVHIPRRQYVNGLSGIPTIRMFEVLACGIPLLCAPWQDEENLFRPGTDYLTVADGRAMKAEIEHLINDEAARRQLADSALQTIRTRHTCRHRAEQLDGILAELTR